MTRLIEMIIQNPVFGIFCIISMLAHPTSQCLTSFTNIQKSRQTKQWSIETEQNNKQRSTKYTHKTNDLVTRTPQHTWGEHRC
jgi:uncharacterized membrane protein